MKKFLPALLLLILLPAIALATAGPTFAACGTISVSSGMCSISGGVSCGTSNPLACCSPASDCATAPTPPATTVDGPWYNQGPDQFANKVKGGDQNEIFGERYTFAQINWIINSLNAMLNPTSGLDSTSLQELFNLINPYFLPHASRPNVKSLAKFGLPGILVGSISDIYASPPASGIAYIQDKIASLQIVPHAYAASPPPGGFGFNSLTAVQKLWTASRNMAYLLMVILLVASGFLIMFRVKINPQTVVSLQTMIPKLIVTLLLVTFSFAIAGLVIDLVYVLLIFMISMFSFNGVFGNSATSVISWFTTPNFANVILYFIEGPAMVILTTITISFITSLILGPFLAIPVIGLLLAPFFAGLGTLLVIISLILILVLAYFLFKIWWMLMKSYVVLILLIIIGPWQIMLDLIPGQNGFGSWIRNIIANASVFLVVPLMFMLNMVFWNPTPTIAGIVFNPLGTTSTATGTLPSFPLFGGKDSVFFNLAVAFAILALTPKVADMIRDALKVPAFKYGNAFGEALWNPMSKFGAQYGTNWIGDRRAARDNFSEMAGWEKALYVASQVGKTSGQVK